VSNHRPACVRRNRRGWASQSQTSKQAHWPASEEWIGHHRPAGKGGTGAGGPASTAQESSHRPAFGGGTGKDVQASRPIGPLAELGTVGLPARKGLGMMGQPVQHSQAGMGQPAGRGTSKDGSANPVQANRSICQPVEFGTMGHPARMGLGKMV
jgi:hypothetical protein